LGLRHPITGDDHEWRSPLPEDLEALLATLHLSDDETAGS